MLNESSTWWESSVGEVDLRSDPNASQESVSAVLKFLMTDAWFGGSSFAGVLLFVMLVPD